MVRASERFANSSAVYDFNILMLAEWWHVTRWHWFIIIIGTRIHTGVLGVHTSYKTASRTDRIVQQKPKGGSNRAVAQAQRGTAGRVFLPDLPPNGFFLDFLTFQFLKAPATSC